VGYVEHVVDLERLEEHASLVAADDVFCCLGTTRKQAGSPERFRQIDFGIPEALGRAAAERGTGQFLLVSSVGASPRAGSLYLRTKGELEEALAGLRFRALHVFRPSFLVGERQEKRPGERAGIAVAKGVAWAMVGGLKRYRPVKAEVVARAMLAAAGLAAHGVQVYEGTAIKELGA